jgi:type I restriction enzyme S subunit
MNLVRVKDIATLVSNKSSNIGNLPYLPLEEVQCWNGKVNRFQSNDDFSGDVNLFEEGDLLFNKLRPYLAKVVHADRAGGVSGEAMVMRPTIDVEGKYLLYALLSPGFIDRIDSLTYGTKMPRANPTDVMTSKLYLPSVHEQKRLINNIDAKCNAIDKKINTLKQKLIHLDEYKTALIHNAVTKGLDAKGCRILDGEESCEFETMRIQDFSVERSVKVNDTDYQPLSVTKNGIVPRMEGVATTIHNDNRKQVIEGDFVINSRADRKGSSGVSPLTGSVSVISTVLNLNNVINGKYAHYLFRGNDFIEKFFMAGKGIVLDLWSTNPTAMKKISIVLPPIETQVEIGKYLDIKTKTIEKSIKAINKKIALLVEYKKSLINEAVSGYNE